ncbi:MAG: cysteine synthase A [Nitrospirae bacterium]|nr:cysteine synthase A [Nitrospirota bacterium]MBF0592287.1 cysteine synthase A [Nitrospirota bacterium]
MKTTVYSEPVNSVLGLIGNTPIVRLKGPEMGDDADGGAARIYAKVEFFNPCSSIKDRICKAMIDAAEAEMLIKPGDTVIEPTSGNTGIGLAFVCANKGYKLVLTMPETMSLERRTMLKAFGAELVLTPGGDMTLAVEKANALAKAKGYFQLNQFKNPANPEAHRKTTAQEIMSQLSTIDVFIAGVGTGGTITGVGEVLKAKTGARIVAVEPMASAVLSGQPPAHHEIQGIGAGFVPDVLNRNIIDEIIQVSDEDAYQYTRKLIRNEGILCGISSGANYFASCVIAQRLGRDKTVLTVLPDTAERYLSTRLFDKVPSDCKEPGATWSGKEPGATT